MRLVFSCILEVLRGFAQLMYPSLCITCRDLLLGGEDFLCTHCAVALPVTGFEAFKDNPLSMVFWGRLPIETGTALCWFEKGGKVQTLVHHFKYRGDLALGEHLGCLLGKRLRHASLYKDLDVVTAVPLHPAKERRRGFNQSAVLAQGIARALDIAFRDEVLVRRSDTATQTKKSRFRRWENVSDVFEVRHQDTLENKHILLVDDVITTGSTLEACGQQLLQVKGVKLWIACLAITA